MRALTIWQPWASLIVGAPPSYDDQPTPPQKPIENRGWCPPEALVGQRIAIHAGKAMGVDVLDDFYDVFKARLFGEVRAPYAKPSLFPRGAVVGVAVLAAVVVTWRMGSEERIVDAYGRNGGPIIDIGDDGRRWYGGDVGWVFREARHLSEPVACTGKQGLWTLPDDAAARVEEQLR